MVMRTAYHQQLDSLTDGIADLCGLAGQAMQSATQALLQADLERAEYVITDHGRITARLVRLEEDAFTLLALQAPVAGELRAVVAAMKNVADVERMAALALHVAKIARRRHPAHALPEDVNGYFAEMGRIAVEIGATTKSVVLERDSQQVTEVGNDDDAMDSLHRHLFTVLMDREWAHGVPAAVDVTLLGRYYERFADHAVEIARRVIYQATGTTDIPH
jgi:phosphate transport system protein